MTRNNNPFIENKNSRNSPHKPLNYTDNAKLDDADEPHNHLPLISYHGLLRCRSEWMRDGNHDSPKNAFRCCVETIVAGWVCKAPATKHFDNTHTTTMINCHGEALITRLDTRFESLAMHHFHLYHSGASWSKKSSKFHHIRQFICMGSSPPAAVRNHRLSSTPPTYAHTINDRIKRKKSNRSIAIKWIAVHVLCSRTKHKQTFVIKNVISTECRKSHLIYPDLYLTHVHYVAPWPPKTSSSCCWWAGGRRMGVLLVLYF